VRARDVIPHTANEIYDRIGRPGQTLALNLFGFRNRRRIAAWTRYLSEVAPTERMPREEQIRRVEEELRGVLIHAVRTVPRYESLTSLLSHLEDPSSDAYALLTEFPVVTKQDVKENLESYLSRDPGPGKIVKTKTSGTTGTPFTTWLHEKTFTDMDALWWRRNVWSGYRRGDWIARLVGEAIVPLSETAPRKPWRVSWVDRRLYLSTWHLTRDNAEAYLDVLEERRPAFIMGYPSSLEILAAFASEAGRTLEWSPRAVWYSSEVMHEHQRELIGRVFRAPIVGLYGCAERVVSASQCEEGRFHLSIVDGYVEGQFDRLELSEPALVTTLTNRVMPLIRFDLGDVIEVAHDETCPCGRTLPIMRPIVARAGDWLVTPSGRRIAPAALTLVFKDLPGVRRSQIEQVDERTIVIHLDADEEAIAPASAILEEKMGHLVSGEMEIRCVRDTELEKSGTGKVQFVVNRLRSSAAQEDAPAELRT